MGSREDPNPISNESSATATATATATEPFLSSSTAVEEESESNQQYLHITYNSGPRSFKDLPFLILFLLFLLSTFAFGIFAIVHRNTASSCVNPSSTPLSLSLSLSLRSFPHWAKALTWTLLITFLLSLPLCWALLLSLNHYTKHIVYASLPFFILIPIFLNVYWFVACTLRSSCTHAFPLAYRILLMLFVFLLIGIIVWILVVNWHRLELTVSIIGVASNALSRNFTLFGVLPSMTIGLLLYYVPIILFMVFAKFNGKLVVKELEGQYDCVWKEDSWVPAYFALAILTMLWSAAAMVEAQVYVISGTIANWYFSKDYQAPKRSIRTSLRLTLSLLSSLSSLLVLLPYIGLLASIMLHSEDSIFRFVSSTSIICFGLILVYPWFYMIVLSTAVLNHCFFFFFFICRKYYYEGNKV
uniref:Choline transporter-like protein n=1 Tax=Cajanus cajan TaxID=3821 RepID=A0A151TMT7_CAJCA|nr:hypothetical protein KK1_021958 [Cajanus cajan]